MRFTGRADGDMGHGGAYVTEVAPDLQARRRAVLGPCIHPECYEFSAADLDTVAAGLGDGVRALTADGRPALDVPAAVTMALKQAGVVQLDDVDVCTACSDDYFSWRARKEPARQAMVVWRE